MNQQNNSQPAAVLPRRSRRLATIIPASHWISIGYSNEDAQAMEKLQNDMKKYGDVGIDETEIELAGANAADVTLPHHEILLPHWQKFANGLRGRTNVERIEFVGISLPASVLDIMFPTLQSMNLNELMLFGSRLGNEGFRSLTASLKQNTSLARLKIGSDMIDDISVADCLSDAIHNHPSLDSFMLVQCGLNSDILRIIFEGCKRLSQLGIAFEKKLGTAGVALMADFIGSNNPTKELVLNHNNISNNDTSLLASALRRNTHLQELDIRNMDITEDGEMTLLTALFDPTSIDSIIESNHTCKVYTYDDSNVTVRAQRPPLEREVTKINAHNEMSIQQKIRVKVVLALCRQDGELFDLSHFNDLPLQLMPRVLELIQEHTAMRRIACNENQLKIDALSRLFHTLRGWELPLLFENLNRPSTNNSTMKREEE